LRRSPDAITQAIWDCAAEEKKLICVFPSRSIFGLMSSLLVAQSIRFHECAKGKVFVVEARSRQLHYRAGITANSKIIGTKIHYQNDLLEIAQNAFFFFFFCAFKSFTFIVFSSSSPK
jgi:hypothetical protein